MLVLKRVDNVWGIRLPQGLAKHKGFDCASDKQHLVGIQVCQELSLAVRSGCKDLESFVTGQIIEEIDDLLRRYSLLPCESRWSRETSESGGASCGFQERTSRMCHRGSFLGGCWGRATKFGRNIVSQRCGLYSQNL